MLRALAEHGIRPDLVLGTSIGALNGAFIAADPGPEGADRLAAVWEAVVREGVFLDNPVRQAARVAKYRTHLLSNAPLRHVIERYLPVDRFEDLKVPFQCVAACIEDASAVWFAEGDLADPVVASCSVPGLFPAVRIGERHFLDGGLVHSIPVGRALALGATRIFVLQVGRVEQPLKPPTKPWEVATVAFEIGRRHRFVHEMESVPDDVEMHVLPSGSTESPNISIGQARSGRMRERMDAASSQPATTSAGSTRADRCRRPPGIRWRPWAPAASPRRRCSCAGCCTCCGRSSVWSSPGWRFPWSWRARSWSWSTAGRRLFRATCLAVVLMWVDIRMLVGCWALWARSPDHSSPTWHEDHERLFSQALDSLMYYARRWVGLEVELTDRMHFGSADQPLVALARHAGPADSLAVAWLLSRTAGRLPRIVLAEALRWDPGHRHHPHPPAVLLRAVDLGRRRRPARGGDQDGVLDEPQRRLPHLPRGRELDPGPPRGPDPPAARAR